MKAMARWHVFFLLLCCLATSVCYPESWGRDSIALNKELKEHLHFDQAGPNRVGYFYIPLDKPIDQATMIYIKTGLDYYREHRPVFIILHLNTPGGEILAAEQISTLLCDIDAIDGIPVVAYIDKWAVSAGALLAYSCRFIAIAKDATMGAAQPVLEGAGGTMEPASEKIVSALRAVFANQAAYYGRNPWIAEAMVDASILLVSRDGQIIKLDSINDVEPGGTHPDEIISPASKLLTLTAQQLMDYGVADFLATPLHREALTAQELSTGQHPASKEPLFSVPYFEQIPNAYVDVYTMGWQTQFFAFLANPMVSSLLMMAMFLGLYMEFTTPGFGVAGTLGLTSLCLIILSHFALEAIPWLDLIMVGVGIILLLLEAFVITGFGFTGIAGIILFLWGLFAIMLPSVGWGDISSMFGTLSAAGEAFLMHLAWLCAALLASLLGILLFSRHIKMEGRLFRRLMLATTEDTAAGYRAGENLATLPPLGAIGTAASPLAPAGRVSFGSDTYDAVSSGMFIAKGEPVVIVSYEGGHMTVAPIRTLPSDKEIG